MSSDSSHSACPSSDSPDCPSSPWSLETGYYSAYNLFLLIVILISVRLQSLEDWHRLLDVTKQRHVQNRIRVGTVTGKKLDDAEASDYRDFSFKILVRTRNRRLCCRVIDHACIQENCSCSCPLYPCLHMKP